MERTMKTIGNHEWAFGMPKSMCAVWDVFYMISTNPNRAQLGRLFAGIIGIMLQGQGNPRYSLHDCDVLAYGGRMQDWLSSKGVSPISVLNLGTELFNELTQHIATEQQVKNAENFSSSQRAE